MLSSSIPKYTLINLLFRKSRDKNVNVHIWYTYKNHFNMLFVNFKYLFYTPGYGVFVLCLWARAVCRSVTISCYNPVKIRSPSSDKSYSFKLINLATHPYSIIFSATFFCLQRLVHLSRGDYWHD